MPSPVIYLNRLTQAVTLHARTAGAEDEHGNPTTLEVDLEVAGFASRQVATEGADAVAVGEQMRLFLAADAPLTGWDAVTVMGEKFEVIGAPWEVWNPRTGAVHHVECDIRRVSTDG
jgi:hypothetical protein